MGFSDHVRIHCHLKQLSQISLPSNPKAEKVLCPFHHSPSLCDYSFFSNQLSHTILLPMKEGNTFLSCDKQLLSPILDLDLNPNWYAISLYIIKTFQAFPSLTCYLWLCSGISLISQRKERVLLHCNVSLKYMAPHPNAIINNLHATQPLI